jgi:prepilin-type N-terminal cleavage/methylation domain-containing protein
MNSSKHASLAPLSPCGRGVGGEGRQNTRHGFTLAETIVALGILGLALVMATELAVRSLRQRAENATRLEALEAAANILEEASARPFAELSPEWAAGQELPEGLARRLDNAVLKVKVEPEEGRPQTKRVSVVLTWDLRPEHPARPVRLATVFSDRCAAKTGGEP